MLLEAINVSDEVDDELVMAAATNSVSKEGAGSKSNDDDNGGKDDRDDNVDSEDDKPD